MDHGRKRHKTKKRAFHHISTSVKESWSNNPLPCFKHDAIWCPHRIQ
uniref:Predicted protein n=1 Tax=Hordeum vulgare subsp. vulgare TaxID=112509 RepID=F2E2D7_HORVV|nr:predicted protein [Hordeum vulgare subsp. vulgare]